MIFRFFGYLFGIGAVLFLAIAAVAAWYISGLTADLPNYDVLAKYEPPVMTRVHAADGQLVAEYAKERRLYLPIQAVPDRVKAAFISAEDKSFYEHSGLDYYGIIRAAFINLRNKLDHNGGPLVGASTITQQVAKNFLLSSDQTINRKIKEAMLSLRIEQAYPKDKILELYLNEIYFGLGAYGVASAALTYFDKSVHELTLAETAYLAALPKGPNNYNPFRHPDRAVERRNWVIDRMVENGYATAQEGEAAKKDPLGVVVHDTTPAMFGADYFAEEVRRELIDMYGEKTLYEGGLSVRTSLNPQLQVLARQSLIDGLVKYDEEHGWRGPVDHIDDLSPDWGPPLAKIQALADVIEWRLAVVLSVDGQDAKIGLQPSLEPGTGKVAPDRETGTIPFDQLKWAKWQTGPKKGKALKSAGDVLVGRRRGLCRKGRRRPRRIYAAPGAGGRGLHRRDGPAHRPRAGHGRRLLLRPQRVQPRHPGRAPARFLLQALRLFRRARQRLHAVLGGHGRAAVHRPGQRPGRVAAGELRGRLPRALDAQDRHRAFAQRHDRAPRPGHGHAADRRIRPPVRHLRQHAAGALHGARRRRDDGAAHGRRLLGVRQRRQGSAPDPDRPHPEPLRPDHLPAREPHLRGLRRRKLAQPARTARSSTMPSRCSTR